MGGMIRPRLAAISLTVVCGVLLAYDRFVRRPAWLALPPEYQDEFEEGLAPEPDHWRPDLAVDGQPGRGPFRFKPRPLHPPDPFDDEPKELPIRWSEGMNPVYQYTSIPPTDNPWPNRPEISLVFFAADRTINDPPVPEWPEAEEVAKVKLQSGTPRPVAFQDLEPSVGSYPTTAPQILPKVQETPDESEQDASERRKRRAWVERAIRHGWEGYKASAWGQDEVRPISNSSRNPFNGWGASTVDALDLFLMLGWDREYALARTHVRALDFTQLSGDTSAYGRSDHVSVPTFETCIRYLGGLIGAYELSGDELMLKRAQELGDWLMGSFGTLSGLPLGKYRFGHNPSGTNAGRVVLAEAGSMSLEFTRLAQLTGQDKYFRVVHRVTEYFDTAFADVPHPKGLFPTTVTDTARSLRGTYSMGGMADSYYEYLIKEHQLIGGRRPEYARMFKEAIASARTHLMADVRVVPDQSILVLGDNTWDRFVPKLDHLTCFAGGMFGLGAKLLGNEADLESAQRLTEACVWAYNVTRSGIAPEGITFYSPTDGDRFIKHKDSNGEYLIPKANPVVGMRRMSGEYKGRPETIESVFYMWRLTGDKKWQDKGWAMFHAFVEATTVKGGFAAISHVQRQPLSLDDYCESFVFAETLKYYWLLFSDNDVMSLDDHVFNTEAHAFRLRNNAPPRNKFDVEAYQDLYDLYEEPSSKGLPDADRPIGRGTAFQQAQMVREPETAKSKGGRPTGGWRAAGFGGGP